jgi:alpha-beta hydrolase superfamily lysophospholipase
MFQKEIAYARPTIMSEILSFPLSDGYITSVVRYGEGDANKPRLVFLHGIQSHSGWYGTSCEQLAEQGYEVHFLERRGCGLNQAARGDCPSFRRLLDDVAEYLRSLPQEKKTILGAISWGGKLGAALNYRHPNLIAGLVLIAPGLIPKVAVPFAQKIRIALAKFIRPRKQFPIPLNDPALFTTTTHWLDFLAKDPLALHTATARMLANSSLLDIYLRRAVKRNTFPTLLLLASEDRIIDNAQTRLFVEKFPGPKQIIEYPNAHHTLEFEPNGPIFVADLLCWLEQFTPTTGTSLLQK